MKVKGCVILVVLMAIALFARISVFPINNLSLWSDDAIYAIIAKEFSKGNFLAIFHPHWQPLFPFIIALFYFLTGDLIITPYAVSLFFGVLFVPLFYLFVYFLTKSKLVAFFSSAYIAIFTPLVGASVSAYSESLLVFVSWSALFVLWHAFIVKTPKTSFVAGLLLGLSFLTKSEGILFITAYFGFAVFYIIHNLFKRKLIKKYIFKHLLLVFIGFVLVFFGRKLMLTVKYGYYPVLAKYYYLHARPGSAYALSQNGDSTWAQDVWSPRTADPQQEIYNFPKTYIDRKGYFLELMIERTVSRAEILLKRNVLSYMNYFGYVLVALGLFWMARYSKSIYTLPFFSVIFVSSFVGLTFFAPSVQPRYLYFLQPIVPLLMFVGVFGIYKLLRLNNSILLGLLLVGTFTTLYSQKVGVDLNFDRQLLKEIERTEVSLLEISDRWLMKNDPGQKVMSTHEGVAVLSDSRIIYPPITDNPEELFEYAKRREVKYIVASQDTIHSVLWSLHEGDSNYKDLSLAYQYQRIRQDHTPETVRIYEVLY